MFFNASLTIPALVPQAWRPISSTGLSLEITDDTSPLAGSGPHNHWRNQLLAQLIDAHDALDSNNNADEMLQCFFAMAEKKDAVDASVSDFVQLHAAALRCFVGLINKVGSNTDDKLYDEFSAWLIAHSGRTRRSLYLAHLHLNHPKNPIEVVALEYLRERDGQTQTPKEDGHHNRLLQRTLDVAIENNNPANAAWIKEHLQQRLDPATGRFAPPTKRELALHRFREGKNTSAATTS